jgi:hypothetical protein
VVGSWKQINVPLGSIKSGVFQNQFSSYQDYALSEKGLCCVELAIFCMVRLTTALGR